MVGDFIKKNIKVIICLIVALFLSGCGITEYHEMKIDNNKKVILKSTIAVDEELIDDAVKISKANNNIEVTDDMRWEYIDSYVEKYTEWNKEKYEKDGYRGYILTYKNDLYLDDITTTDNIDNRYVYLSTEDIKNQKLFTKVNDTYKSNIRIQVPDAYSFVNGDANDVMVEVSFTLILPNDTISNNADSVSKNNKELTWTIKNSKDFKDIDVEFNIKKTSIYLYVTIILAVLLFVIGLVFMIKRK